MALLAGVFLIVAICLQVFFQKQDQRTIWSKQPMLTEFIWLKHCLQNFAKHTGLFYQKNVCRILQKIILATEICKTICPLLKKNFVIFGLNSAEEFCRTILHKSNLQNFTKQS